MIKASPRESRGRRRSARQITAGGMWPTRMHVSMRPSGSARSVAKRHAPAQAVWFASGLQHATSTPGLWTAPLPQTPATLSCAERARRRARRPHCIVPIPRHAPLVCGGRQDVGTGRVPLERETVARLFTSLKLATARHEDRGLLLTPALDACESIAAAAATLPESCRASVAGGGLGATLQSAVAPGARRGLRAPSTFSARVWVRRRLQHDWSLGPFKCSVHV